MNSTGTLKRLTRRVGLGVVSMIAIFGLSTTFASPASAFADNTAKSSTGAYLQATGRCEGGTYDLTVYAQNFEYIALGTVTPTGGTIWTEFAPTAQNLSVRAPLPYQGRRYVAYEIMGADDVGGGQWEYVSVFATFDFFMAGDNYTSNWC